MNRGPVDSDVGHFRRAAGALAAALTLAATLAACSSPPPLPVAPADYLELRPGGSLQFLDGDRPVPADQGRLVGPSFAVQFKAVGTTPTITAPQGRNLQASEGHEFVFVTTDFVEQFTREDFQDKDVTAQLVVAGAVKPLPKVPRNSDALIASVPLNSSVGLQVIDQGRTQTFDLRTGSRGPDAVKLYYPTKTQSLTKFKHETFGTVSIGGRNYRIDVGVDSIFQTTPGATSFAALEPFSSQYGWAPEGRAWLIVRGLGIVNDINLCGCQPELDLARNIILTLPDGSTVRPPGGGKIPIFALAGGTPPAIVFDVADSFRAGTITVTFDGSVSYRQDNNQSVTTNWRIVPNPAELPISLPQ